MTFDNALLILKQKETSQFHLGGKHVTNLFITLQIKNVTSVTWQRNRRQFVASRAFNHILLFYGLESRNVIKGTYSGVKLSPMGLQEHADNKYVKIVAGGILAAVTAYGLYKLYSILKEDCCPDEDNYFRTVDREVI